MDLSRVPNERKLYLCKWYFKVGFALLPFVWAINTVWFFSEAFRKPTYDEQKEIRKYVIFSGIGSLIWFIIILSWVMTFQLKRTEWGDFADSISFIIPLGRA
ncbi:gamma-secretase subunit pen-2 [Ochlerotatus camptorhynchus]|uniref:gamma-secretase subunit pen-2 n=1 Tax=Ochlerotatus camptorhynchus TaxID=644619 RepID=UPI0031D04747